MLTAKQAAPLLGISARSVYALAKAGKLACHRMGLGDAAVRFDPADIEAYKQSCRLPATTRAEPTAEPEQATELPAAFVRHFGLDRPKVAPPEPPPTLTAYQLRKLKTERERCRQEDQRALIAFHANKRRAARIKRTPPWVDLDAMRGIYEEAQRLSRITGIPHHVDHIYPLQGVLVSGLHVAGNLQILTASENSKKRNRYEV